MIEQSVILVIVDDKDGLGPHIRIGRDRIELAGDERSTGCGHVFGMFRCFVGRPNPRHGR